MQYTPTPSNVAQFATPGVSPAQLVAYAEVPKPPTDIGEMIRQIMPLLVVVMLMAMILPMMRGLVRGT